MPIELDPGTICARTNAGEVELQGARSGLTLPQRKTLSLLVAPQAFAELAAENHLEPVRLGRDLVRLAEIGLIVLLVPAARNGHGDQIANTPKPTLLNAAVVRGLKRLSALHIVIAAALALAIAAAWLALRGSTAPGSAPPIAPRAAAPTPITAAAAESTDGDDAARPAAVFSPPARGRNRGARPAGHLRGTDAPGPPRR